MYWRRLRVEPYTSLALVLSLLVWYFLGYVGDILGLKMVYKSYNRNVYMTLRGAWGTYFGKEDRGCN